MKVDADVVANLTSAAHSLTHVVLQVFATEWQATHKLGYVSVLIQQSRKHMEMTLYIAYLLDKCGLRYRCYRLVGKRRLY